MGKFSFQMNVQFTVAPYLGEGDVDNIHAQAVVGCAQVGIAWPSWYSQRGCCTAPTNTHTCQ